MNALADVVAAAEPALAAHAVPDPGPSGFADPVQNPTRRFVLEAVHEGYQMHYGTPRAFHGMDHDLRLLAGDALYALGLSRVAEAGDLGAVAELADLISLTAQVHAEGRPEVAAELWKRSTRTLSGDP